MHGDCLHFNFCSHLFTTNNVDLICFSNYLLNTASMLCGSVLLIYDTEALDLSLKINIMQQQTMPPKIITRSRNPQNTPTAIRDDIRSAVM